MMPDDQDDRPLVMVVDDDPSILLLIDIVGERQGFRVKGVSSGLQALEELREGMRPAVILLDIMMERIDGLTFLAHLNEMPDLSGIPVIAMSTQSVLDRYISRLNVSDTLVKPFTLDEVAERLRKYRM